MARRYEYNAVCTMPECDMKHEARGLCRKHYCRQLKHGDATVTLKTMNRLVGSTYEEKFYSAVNTAPGQGPNGDCHEWQGSKDNRGYGHARFDNRKVKAHRLAWQLANGREPQLHILHRCDNPPCVNPAHLREGTHQENMREWAERGEYVPRPSISGESNHAAVLTTNDVLAIREELRAGTPQRQIASRFDVTQSAVSLIKRGIRWAHV